MSEIPRPSKWAAKLDVERMACGPDDSNAAQLARRAYHAERELAVLRAWKARAVAFLDNVHAHAAGEVCTPDTCALSALLGEE